LWKEKRQKKKKKKSSKSKVNVENGDHLSGQKKVDDWWNILENGNDLALAIVWGLRGGAGEN
jgi:hypothetical protein